MRNKTIQSNSRRTISFTGLLLLLLIAISQLACPELVGLIEEPKKEEETDTGAKAAASAQGILHFSGIPSGTNPSPTLTNLQNADVFIIYTNLSTTQSYAIPNGSATPVQLSLQGAFSLQGQAVEPAPINQVPDFITEFNNSKVTLIPGPSFNQQGGSFNGPISDPNANTVGVTTRTWRTSDGTAATTLRGSATMSNGKKVLVWVGNNDYSTNESTNQVMTPNRVNTVLTKFGTDAANIYDMTKKLYGEEWGAHNYNNLISPTQNEIHIVYYDINNDGAWGVLGYFWAVNNILNHSNGNNALVFFMDSATMGAMEGGQWNLTLQGPGVMMTTLAHEFQHMIHFYEKQILKNTASPTWLNELASTASEDILANYITGSNTGPLFGNGSRLAQFAATPICNLTAWASSQDQNVDCNIFDSYAHVTSFGTFLSRHYSGNNFNFFKELVASTADSTTGLGQAIERAKGTTNPTTTQGNDAYAEAFVRWGASIVLNPAKRTVPDGYGYPAKRIANFFAPGRDLILDQANIWSFPTKPRIYSTPPANIQPMSHIVVRHKSNITQASLDMNADITAFTNSAVLNTNSTFYKTTILVQAH